MASSGDEFEQTLEQFKDADYTGGDNKSNYTVQALLAAIVPIYAFHSILDLNVLDNFLIYGLVTVTVTFILSFAFYNVSYNSKIRLIPEREKNINTSSVYAEAQAKGLSKKEHLENKKKEQAELTGKEASAYSVLYNSLVFHAVTIVLGFYVFYNTPSYFNYIISLVVAASVTAYVSTLRIL